MKPSEAKPAYTFDDLMLVPQHSSVRSRSAPDVSATLAGKKIDIPIVAAPMNTVCESGMMLAMDKLGGVGVLHRGFTIKAQIDEIVKATSRGASNFYVATGATGDYLERVENIYDTLGILYYCIDVANGHSVSCLKAVEALSDKYIIMAGNVCTYEGAYRLAEAGAKSIRVGIGPGSMCKTRIVTGHGVPQLTAIEDCARIKDRFPDVTIIADGGLRGSGDIVKALAAGADTVMIGGLLAGTEETPGEIIDNSFFPYSDKIILDPKPFRLGKFKKYAGMASEEGRKGWIDRSKTSFVPEGVSTEVPYKGPVKDVIDGLVNGLRVGMSYAGAMSITELQQNAEWVRVTENGRVEGTPHGEKIIGI